MGPRRRVPSRSTCQATSRPTCFEPEQILTGQPDGVLVHGAARPAATAPQAPASAPPGWSSRCSATSPGLRASGAPRVDLLRALSGWTGGTRPTWAWPCWASPTTGRRARVQDAVTNRRTSTSAGAHLAGGTLARRLRMHDGRNLGAGQHRGLSKPSRSSSAHAAPFLRGCWRATSTSLAPGRYSRRRDHDTLAATSGFASVAAFETARELTRLTTRSPSTHGREGCCLTLSTPEAYLRCRQG
jgi:hypothetical protein